MRGKSILVAALAALALSGCAAGGVEVSGGQSALTPPAARTYGPAVEPRGEQLASLGPVQVLSQKISCVPYARELSGLEIRGDAWTWWDGASGLYDRGSRPKVGSVIVMKKVKSMPRGHVAYVTGILNTREIVVDHANWRRGEVHRGALMRDVSKKNDWSLVQVWYPPIGDYGTGQYPIAGFIYQPPLTGPQEVRLAE